MRAQGDPHLHPHTDPGGDCDAYEGADGDAHHRAYGHTHNRRPGDPHAYSGAHGDPD